MSLERYNQLRQFDQTPEPSGEVSENSSQWRFSIQKHQASRLHYDLRIEMNGVLKSWAIPKGPCLDPKEKRLAIQTEDHPIAYVDFEGVIPKGQYGGGAVLLWDLGTWESIPGNEFETGDFKFRLYGKKLRGGWMLVKTNKRGGDPKHWLLFKERDEYAVPMTKSNILDTEPYSVLTGRSLVEVENNPNAIWKSGELQISPRAHEIDTFQANKVKIGRLNGASQSRFAFKPIKPSLPTLSKSPPTSNKWVHEIKHDGYRMLCFVKKDKVVFYSRNGKDWTSKLKFLAAQMGKLNIKNAILDGEVAAVNRDGITDFQELQNRIGRGNAYDLKYYIFDLLFLNDHDITRVPLGDRKRLLESLLPSNHPVFIYSEHLGGSGIEIFDSACQLGAEGIVSKHVDSQYSHGRNSDWVKIKRLLESEFVIGGFTLSPSGRDFAAILVGRYDSQGNFFHEGRVGTGFTDATLSQLGAQLKQLQIASSPFANLDSDAGKEFRWVNPELVTTIEYGGWTKSHQLRFATFRGIREETVANALLTDRPHDGTNLEGQSSVQVQQESGLHISESSLNALSNVRFTNPERIMYPDVGLTKLDVATYMAQFAERMLPFVIDRPLALVRCPKGCREKCFFQKKPPEGISDSVELIQVKNHKGKSQDATVIRGIEGLLTLTQFSALEIHNWNCRVDLPQRPDMVVFDIDPDETLPFSRVRDAAFQIKLELEQVGLVSYLKTSGGKGLHVVVPVQRRTTWSGVSQFSDRLVGHLVSRWPKSFTNRHAISARKEKVYIDVLRNRFGSTAISPFSPRAREGGPLAMPIEWEYLDHLKTAQHFNIRNAFPTEDGISSWEGFFDCNQSLTKRLIRHWD